MTQETEISLETAEKQVAAARVDDMTAGRVEAVQRRLRGRYHWAIVLALLGAISGGIVGYITPTPMYRSTGQIRVAPVVPRVLYADEQKAMLPRFEAFIQTQCDLIAQQQVIHQAMASDAWQQLGRGTSDGEYLNFARNLEAKHPQNTETIYVHFYDPDPQAALAAVNAVLDAYMANYKEHDVDDDVQRLNILQERRDTLAAEVQALRQQILDETEDLGSETLEQLYEARLTRIEKLEEELDQVQMALYTAQESMPDENAPLSLDALALADPQMRQYLSQREQVEHELARLRASFGDEHRAVKEQMGVLDSVNRTIESYVNQVARTGNGAGPFSADLLRLRTQERGLKAKVDAARTEAESLAQVQMRLARLRNDEQMAQQNLDRVVERIDQLNLESAFSGRISILARGDLPVKPEIDSRKKVAVAMGVLGATAGFGVVLLIGILDPRIRSLNDAIASIQSTTVLGMLPTMPDDLTDVESVTNAAHCVHNIRTMMQIGSTREDRHVFVITSPGPQTGKTSLSIALGLSFAGTGTKTLLLDCDLIGGGLSGRARVILDGDAVPDNATGMGLLDAATGEPLSKCVLPTQIPNLDLLPLGDADDSDVNRLSPKAIRRLLDEVRKHYDTVIIDTGPTPGSLEASLVGAQADGVVLVVSRGEDRVHTERAVDHLRSCGANVIGMVFNRADARDMEESGATSVSRRSIRRQDRDIDQQFVATGLFNSPDGKHIGPIGRSVGLSSTDAGNARQDA
jgi:capsular exopolysaccharide synthesis family protein